MARFEFKLPDIGEGIAEAEIVAWHVKPGDVVEEDAPVADMMTDKATVELSAPVSGRVVEINGGVGENIAIGSVLAVFETEGGDQSVKPLPSREGMGVGSSPAEPSLRAPASVPDTPTPSPEGQGEKQRVLASPAVRKRAKDLVVDLAQVHPSAEGRIRHSDLDAYLRYSGAERTTIQPDRIEEIKVVGLRRRIAGNTAEAKRRIPHFTYVEELDVTALEALRAALNGERGDRPKLTILPFLIRALAQAMPRFPMINAHYDDEAQVIRRHSSIHAGIATQTDSGLTVPVVRDAGTRDIWQLAAEIARLAEAVRSVKARHDELTGSTITVTSLGPLGGIVSTPVINRPEVAIIGVNRIVERPAVIGGRIEVRKLMNLSSSFDHRVVDGWDAASFIQAVKGLIETPALLFINRR